MVFFGRLCRAVLVAGAVTVAGLATSSPVSEPLAPPHRAITVGSGSLRLRAVRAGAGPVVVLLHGFGESLLAWQGVFDRLSREADVVALDLPGFGSSSKPRTGYSTDSLAWAVLRAMDTLDIRRAVLVGHSMGGAVAAAVSVAAPDRVRGLAMIDPAVVSAPWLREAGATSERNRDLVRRGIAGYEALRMRFAGAHDPAWLAESDSAMAYNPATDADYVTALQAVLREFDFFYISPERARRLQLPIIILWGEYDLTVSVELGRALANALPTSEFHVVDRSWHRPHVERPAEVAGLIAGFLRRLPDPQSPGDH